MKALIFVVLNTYAQAHLSHEKSQREQVWHFLQHKEHFFNKRENLFLSFFKDMSSLTLELQSQSLLSDSVFQMSL